MAKFGSFGVISAGNMTGSNDGKTRNEILGFPSAGFSYISQPKSHQMLQNLAMILGKVKSDFSAPGIIIHDI